ncbi:hypothetical protein ANO14919_020440 [Xylariales sp. No.14919]|nr:hypothetical protein F5X98DRAFT_195510 [Xylaria grammica]GAW12674.1 hypothetical protein ANO14919_020440 [Xylariales sp. No.14919]
MTMENTPPSHTTSSHHSPADTNASSRKRSSSGASILSKFPFLRTSESKSNLHESRFQQPSSASGDAVNSENASDRPPRALAAAMSQQKTRRRRGSLRKVALLGRGAAREKRESKPQPEQQQQQQLPQPLALETAQILLQQIAVHPPIQQQYASSDTMPGGTIVGLGLSDGTPHSSTDSFASRPVVAVPAKPFPALNYDTQMKSPTISYTSTTDEDDGLSTSLPVPLLSQPDRAGFSSGSESYFRNSSHRAQSPAHSIQRRRSTNKQQYAKSPLSLQGLATGSPALGNMDSGHHDYSETEWWGWVVLIVTWFVFIVGMGSCLNIWSWAWDVGSTPYAPPELEDDPTLPIVGYYPALIILTSIMAWVWVIVAWVGMKYFRHAKISGD